MKENTNKIPNDWVSYFCRIEDKPASIRLNLALDEVAPIPGFETKIWFSVKLLNPDENGFTTNEEFPTICDIEDEISAALEKMGMLMVGAVKSDGTFDQYFYAKNSQKFEEVIALVMKKFPNYLYATNAEIDEEWDDYFGFLYPDEYDYQGIQNQKVLMSLEKQGDNPEAEREIDHWLYFKTAENLANFISNVEEIGYKMLSNEKLNEGENPYQVNVSKVSNATRNTINENVWELVSLAKKFDGDYDGWGCPIEK